MHEPLHKHMHSTQCLKIIEALSICHRVNKFWKYFGVCNDLKTALDACLTKEYNVRRNVSHESSLIRKYKLRQLIEKGKEEYK